jgi:hypothetical protein
MKPARVGNAMVDGVAIGPEGERTAIEVILATMNDDLSSEAERTVRKRAVAIRTSGRG